MRHSWLGVLPLVLSLGAAAPARAAPDTSDQAPPAAQTGPPSTQTDEDTGGLLRQASLFSAAGSKVPWRGSQLVLRNAVSPVSLDPGADQTHNPYYAMTWSLRPWWWFSDRFFARAQLDVIDELTEADETTYAGEALLDDMLLVAGGNGLWTIPYARVHLSADLVLTIPTSKASRARTLVLGLGPGMRLSRSFALLQGVVVGYNLRLTPRFFRFTTAERETPLIPGRPDLVNTGQRNPYFRLTQVVDASVRIRDWLGASLALGHAIDWLYDLPGELSSDVPEISHVTVPDQGRQFLTFFELTVSFQPLEELEIGVGYTALHPQLRPDSSYYVPFFNRYSAFFVDLKLHAEAVVTRVRRILR